MLWILFPAFCLRGDHVTDRLQIGGRGTLRRIRILRGDQARTFRGRDHGIQIRDRIVPSVVLKGPSVHLQS